MTVIELPDEEAAELEAKAAAQGLTLKDWLKNLASESRGSQSPSFAAGSVVAEMRPLRARVKPDPEGWTTRDYVHYGRRYFRKRITSADEQAFLTALSHLKPSNQVHYFRGVSDWRSGLRLKSSTEFQRMDVKNPFQSRLTNGGAAVGAKRQSRWRAGRC